MFSVVVYINHQPIICRSARRITGEPGDSEPGIYNTDDGRTLKHRYTDGAAKLAIALLRGVHNP